MDRPRSEGFGALMRPGTAGAQRYCQRKSASAKILLPFAQPSPA